MSVSRVNELHSGDSYKFKISYNPATTERERLTLLLSLVREHRTESDISDTFNPLDGSVEFGIDDNSTLVIDLDTNLLQSESIGDRSSTDSY